MELPQSEKMANQRPNIPQTISILPLRDSVAFPFTMAPLSVGIVQSIMLVEDAVKGDHLIGLLASKDPDEHNPMPGQLYDVGTVARIHRILRCSLDEKKLNLIIEGIERFKVSHWKATSPYLRAHVRLAPELYTRNKDMDALMQGLRDMVKQVAAMTPDLPYEFARLLDQINDPRHLVYTILSNLSPNVTECQRILEMDSLMEKYHAVICYLAEQKEILRLGRKIKTEAKKKVGKEQRDYFLRHQLKAIQKELGESAESESEGGQYAERIEKGDLPPEAKKEAQREVKRMAAMPTHAAEYSVIKTYLDWLLDMSWHVLSEDRLDASDARRVLDEDHYCLDEIKTRIIEFLAVHKLVRERGFQPAPRGDNHRRPGHGRCALLRRPAGGGQNQPGPKHCTGSGAQVHPYEFGRHAG